MDEWACELLIRADQLVYVKFDLFQTLYIHYFAGSRRPD